MIKLGLYTQHIDEFGFTGPNVYQTNLINHLSSRNDIELYLIHCNKNRNQDFYKKYNNIVIPKSPILGELATRKYDLDLIHFNYIPWEFRFFYFFLKQKTLATSHISINQKGNINWENYAKTRSLIEPLHARHLDTIIAVSKDLKFRLLKYLKVPESKIKVVHEGIDRNIFRELKDNEHDQLENTKFLKKPFIIHVSNFSNRKNPKTLLHTFKRLLQNGYKGDLIIVGSGWLNSITNNLLRHLGIQDRVKITGYVQVKKLAQLLNNAQVAFFPSLHENFCFPIVEAMACGTPVVASKVYSIPEIAGDAAILNHPMDEESFANNITKILENESLKEEMKKKGLENSKRFSWKKCTQQTVNIYKQLLNTNLGGY